MLDLAPRETPDGMAVSELPALCAGQTFPASPEVQDEHVLPMAVADTFGRCAQLYCAQHTEEMTRLLHLGAGDVRLLTVLTHAGPLGLSRLTALAGASAAGMDSALERLIDCGFASRRRGRVDRRTIDVEADPARTAALGRVPTGTLLALTQCLEGLSADTLTTACEALSGLESALMAMIREHDTRS